MTELTPRGRRGLVTGASSGVGRAIALHMAGEGAALCLTGRDAARLHRTADQARALGGHAVEVQADLACEEDLHRLAREAAAALGALDLLVHAAGGIVLGTLQDVAAADLDRQYEVHVRAPYILTQDLLRHLSDAADIVFVNSSVGLQARGRIGQYAAAKYAQRALADSLRDEVNPRGIRVVSLFLGRTATPMQSAVRKIEGKPYEPEKMIQPEDVARIVANTIALPRNTEITEISLRPTSRIS